MKCPYTTLDITTSDCGARTSRIRTKLWLEEWTAVTSFTVWPLNSADVADHDRNHSDKEDFRNG
jgi:hypothetical protein